MKKLMVMLGAVALVASVQAMSVNWKATAAKGDLGYTVYVVSGAKDSWESEAQVAAASIGSAEVVSASGGRAYSASGSASGTFAKGDTLNVVVVDADGKNWAATSFSTTGFAYDDKAQPPETAPSGAASFALTGLSYTAFAPTPEPTSALLLLLGVAGLALKRKQA